MPNDGNDCNVQSNECDLPNYMPKSQTPLQTQGT